MARQRKPANSRLQEFRLAIVRIANGRSRFPDAKLSVSAVAREVGVSPALIHNHYPKIAEEVRDRLGRASKAAIGTSPLELERKRNRELREELRFSKQRIAQLATINEMLLIENAQLKSTAASRGTVAPLRRDPKRSKP
jgi:transposase-like protein